MSGINKHVQHIRTSSIEYVKILKENIPSTANIVQLTSVPTYSTIISNETNGIENPIYIQVTTNNWYYKLVSKKPSIDNLLYGEIAIAYKKGFETFFIKNSNNEIIEFLPVNRLPLTKNLFLFNTKLTPVNGVCSWNINYDDIISNNIDIDSAVVHLREISTGKQIIPDVTFDNVGKKVQILISSKQNIEAGSYKCIIIGNNLITN